jgi:membrane protein implicated in regulation of membrane protease activity
VADWVLWVIAAGVLAVGEVVTMGFFLGPIAIAAAIAALAALAGGGTVVQFLVFIVCSVASIGFLRPIARRHMHTPAQIRTGTAALIGSRALVLERVDADGGSVKIGGEVWSARASEGHDVIEPGARVTVLSISGATAVVVAQD